MTGLNAVDGQLVAPATEGQVRVPSAVGSLPGRRIGRAVLSDAARPRDAFHEGLGQQQLAGQPVEDVEETIPVGMQQELWGRPRNVASTSIGVSVASRS